MVDFILALIGVEVFSLVIVAIWGVWSWLGGWPEAHYRVWGIVYFRQVIFEEDGTPNTWILKKEIIHSSLPQFENSGGLWQVPDPEDTGRYRGRPSYYYNRGDSRPIPLRSWTKHEDKWNPELQKAAYDDDSIERARSLGRKLPFPVIWIFVVALIACVIAGVAAYYSHETLCAVKPLVC